MVRSLTRFAAGVCVLAAGVLMAGQAVSVADPGLGGAAPNGDHRDTNSLARGGPTAGSNVGNVTNTVRQTTQSVTQKAGLGAQTARQPSIGATSRLGSEGQPGEQSSTGARTRQTAGGGTDEDQNVAGLGTADPNPVATVSNVLAPVTNAALADHPDAVAPDTIALAPVSDVLPPVSDVLAPVSDVLAPVSDVLAPGRDMVTLVAGAVLPLTQLPSDLSQFMLVTGAGVAPAGNGSGGIGSELSPAAGAVADISVVAAPGNATRRETLDVIALGRASALSEVAPEASFGANLMGAETHFPGGFYEYLLVTSLWVLAAVAVPGLGGLVICTVVGVRMQIGGQTRLHTRGEHRASRASPVPQAIKRWMSAR